MIELTLSYIASCILERAKTFQKDQRLHVAREGRRKPYPEYFWPGETMEGSPNDVASLCLEWDIGDLSGEDEGLAGRKAVLDRLHGDTPVFTEKLWQTSQTALCRIKEAVSTGEKIRVWAGVHDPEEFCGLCFLCAYLADAAVPVSIVGPSDKNCNDLLSGRIGSMRPENVAALAAYEQPLGDPERETFIRYWREMRRENAPLRVNINGRVTGVPESFFDFALLEAVGEEEVMVMEIIIKLQLRFMAMKDHFLYGRIQALIQSGVLQVVRRAKPGSSRMTVRRSV